MSLIALLCMSSSVASKQGGLQVWLQVAFQVFHSGLPLTLVALDATNTVPLSEAYFSVLGKSTNQRTYEAQYVFQSLKISRDIFFDDSFFQVSLLDCPHNLLTMHSVLDIQLLL